MYTIIFMDVIHYKVMIESRVVNRGSFLFAEIETISN